MQKKVKILVITLIFLFNLTNFVYAKEIFDEQIVVLPFENETRYTNQNYELMITSIIERELQDLNYRIITRDLEQLTDELRLSRSGMVDRAVELGKITGAKKVVSGRILSISESSDEGLKANVIVSIRIVNVETAEVFKAIGIIEETARGSSKESSVNQAFQKIGTRFNYKMRGIGPTFYSNIYSTTNGEKSMKLGVDYQLNPHFALIANYEVVSEQHFFSLNTRFKAFDLESYNYKFSFLSTYRFSKEGGNFRFGPVFSKSINDLLTLVGEGFLLVHLPEPSDEKELSNALYQLGIQYQLLRPEFGFEQINLEFKLSNMLVTEDRRSILSLGVGVHW